MAFDGNVLRKRFNKRFMLITNKNSAPQAFAILALEFTAILSFAAFTVMLWNLSLTLFLPTYLIAMIVIGMRMRCFGNIIHECAHYSFVESRTLNDTIGNLLSVVLMYSFLDYRKDHMSHHIYTGDYEKDRDFADTQGFKFHEPLNIARWLHYAHPLRIPLVVHAYLGRRVFDVSESTFWKVIRIIYVSGLVLALASAMFMDTLSVILVAFWIIPLAITLPAIGFASDIMDHAGLLHNELDIDKSRNYIVDNGIIQWLLFPRNDSYHLLHHLFPGIPTHFLPVCHRILIEECPEYAARPHTLKEWIADFRVREVSSEAR